MPILLEFLLIALLIYLWESVLWLPRQGLAVRRPLFGKIWRVVPATRFIATRWLGAMPMMPLPADSRLHPCTGFPLAAGGDGEIFISSPEGNYLRTGAASWDAIRFSAPMLSAGGHSVRCQSPRTLDALRLSREQGLSPAEGIRKSWEIMLSPPRAKREMKRWRIAVGPLAVHCPVLCIGFFAGLPAAYIILGPIAALWLGAWLWILMLAISMRLFWISKNILPSARGELRQEAFLSLVIPFHAMRAAELACAHAFATTHPAAMLLASGQVDHPWLGEFTRSLLIPRPSNPGDAALSAVVLPPLEKALRRSGLSATHFIGSPDRSDDPEATAWCPRCHGLFLGGVPSCNDCRGIALRTFTSEP